MPSRVRGTRPSGNGQTRIWDGHKGCSVGGIPDAVALGWRRAGSNGASSLRWMRSSLSARNRRGQEPRMQLTHDRLRRAMLLARMSCHQGARVGGASSPTVRSAQWDSCRGEPRCSSLGTQAAWRRVEDARAALLAGRGALSIRNGGDFVLRAFLWHCSPRRSLSLDAQMHGSGITGRKCIEPAPSCRERAAWLKAALTIGSVGRATFSRQRLLTLLRGRGFCTVAVLTAPPLLCGTCDARA